MLNFGPLWRGISVGSDALSKLKPRSVTQLSVIFLLAISKNTSFLEWPPSTLWRPSDWTVLWCECDFWNFEPVNVPRCCWVVDDYRNNIDEPDDNLKHATSNWKVKLALNLAPVSWPECPLYIDSPSRICPGESSTAEGLLLMTLIDIFTARAEVTWFLDDFRSELWKRQCYQHQSLSGLLSPARSYQRTAKTPGFKPFIILLSLHLRSRPLQHIPWGRISEFCGHNLGGPGPQWWWLYRLPRICDLSPALTRAYRGYITKQSVQGRRGRERECMPWSVGLPETFRLEEKEWSRFPA